MSTGEATASAVAGIPSNEEGRVTPSAEHFATTPQKTGDKQQDGRPTPDHVLDEPDDEELIAGLGDLVDALADSEGKARAGADKAKVAGKSLPTCFVST